jgi:hypothetical protein
MTLEKLKLHLIREVKELQNTATWRLHSEQELPLSETLLPVGKRLFIRPISE